VGRSCRAVTCSRRSCVCAGPQVKLLSDLLGTFDETFSWGIKGSSAPLTLQFKGRVCAPSFEVDTDCLDFGVCSFGFR
jgi:hydrocephalus-inducing protein